MRHWIQWSCRRWRLSQLEMFIPLKLMGFKGYKHSSWDNLHPLQDHRIQCRIGDKHCRRQWRQIPLRKVQPQLEPIIKKQCKFFSLTKRNSTPLMTAMFVPNTTLDLVVLQEMKIVWTWMFISLKLMARKGQLWCTSMVVLLLWEGVPLTSLAQTIY